VHERPLHGQARRMPYTAGLFLVAALGVGSLPPFGSFLGKSLVEHGATKAGFGWVVAFFVLVSALCGAALLRAAARVFAGLGAPAERGSDEGGEEPQAEAGREREHTPAALMAPALVLAGAGLAVGIVPGLADHAVAAAERFMDRPSYAQAVLHGAVQAGPSAAHAGAPVWHDWLYSGISVAGGMLLTALLIWPRPVPGSVAGAIGTGRRGLAGLSGLHSGHPGDYVAFVVLGAGVIGGLFALTLG
jgi:multicomponent Na+:H+ antiporter subunit D